jgi:hypothetical protein
MFVHINPEPASAQESLCSLKFAAKVNGCETAAKGGAKRNVTQWGASAALVSTASAQCHAGCSMLECMWAECEGSESCYVSAEVPKSACAKAASSSAFCIPSWRQASCRLIYCHTC